MASCEAGFTRTALDGGEAGVQQFVAGIHPVKRASCEAAFTRWLRDVKAADEEEEVDPVRWVLDVGLM